LLIAGGALIHFLTSDARRNPIPWSFLVLFVGLPTLLHLLSAALAWPNFRHQVSGNAALVGLASTSVTTFVWIVMLTTFASLAEPPSKAELLYYAATCAAALTLPASSVMNAMYFISWFRSAQSSAHRDEA
jgi:hypothetical protein